MKKAHPSQRPPINPEDIYATVNKQGKAQRPSQSQETSRTNIDRGGSSNASRRREEEILYADVIVGQPSSGPRRNPHEETVYADINIGATGGTESYSEYEYVDPVQRSGEKLSQGAERAGPSAVRPVQPLSPDYMAAQLLKDPRIQASTLEIKDLCKSVYGNENALNDQLLEILKNPRKAEDILWDIAANPEKIGSLAGKKVLGIKTPDRTHAEESFVPLCSALEKHIAFAKVAHIDIRQEHTQQQRQERSEDQGRRLEHRAHHHTSEISETSKERDAQQQKHIFGKSRGAMAM